MFHFNNFIDEVRVAALLAGCVVALTTTDQEGKTPWWLYGLCVALILLGMCGGAYFNRTRAQGRTLFLWSFCVLAFSVSLCGFASYKCIEPLGEMAPLWTTAAIWLLIVSGFYWRIVYKRAYRHTGTVNTGVVGAFTTVGVLAGGSAFSLAPRAVLMPIVGFFILIAVGSALLVLLMFHFRALLDSLTTPNN